MVDAKSESGADFLAAYVDAAFGEGIGSAATYFPSLNIGTTRALPSGTSVLGGELEGILLALNTLENKLPEQKPTEFLVYTDSQGALTELKKSLSLNGKATEIKKAIARLKEQRGTRIKIDWVPGHAGIPGNEEVHCLARAQVVSLRDEAVTQASPPRTKDPSCTELDSSMRHESCTQSEDTANNHAAREDPYDPGEVKRRVKELHRNNLRSLLPPAPDPPLPRGLGRKQQVTLYRIRLDVTITPARLASWGKRKDAYCIRCKTEASADQQHLLWSCKGLEDARQKHRPPDVKTLEDWIYPRSGPPDQQLQVLKALLDFAYKEKLFY